MAKLTVKGESANHNGDVKKAIEQHPQTTKSAPKRRHPSIRLS